MARGKNNKNNRREAWVPKRKAATAVTVPAATAAPAANKQQLQP
jgi:hypothetical protein